MFLDCVHGKYTTENRTEWVSREEFNAKKATDAYIALIWSFGNNGKDYLYGKDIEELKHAYHNAIYFGNFEGLNKVGFHLTESNKRTAYLRYLDYKNQISEMKHQEDGFRQEEIERLQALESLQSLQNLQNLQNTQSLQLFGTDYQNVPIPNGALVYCDIPYSSTNCGKYDGFDHQRFYEWAERQENIFISEYDMPDDFVPYAWTEKQILSMNNGNGTKAKEMIYTNRRTYEKLTDTQKTLVSMNFAEQMTLW